MPTHRKLANPAHDPEFDPEFDQPLPGDAERLAKAARDDATILPMKTSQQRFLDEDLRAITSFEDAVRLLGDTEATDASEFGTGFTVLRDEEKRRLVGVPFVILEFRVNPGDYGRPFVSLLVVTKGGEKLVVNDGSTGIAAQIQTIQESLDRTGRPHRGIVCKHGLRVSDYTVDIPHPTTGIPVPTPATTFYLDTSA